MTYPGTINFPNDDDQSLEDIADRVSTRRADIQRPPSSGMQRDVEQKTWSAADFLDKQPATPAVEPATGGAVRGPRDFQHTAAMSMAHNQIRDAHRRPAWHALGTPQVVAEAWQDVLDKLQAAKDAMAQVPVVMAKAERDRAAALTDASEPTVLPSPGDARAWAEVQASGAIVAARTARAEYDRLVQENLEEHAGNLQAAVPSEAEAISARVLDEVAKELEVLRSIASDPTEVALTPSLRDRQIIHRQAQQIPGGVTSQIVDLARREKAEDYKHTQFTRGIPQHVLDNAENSARYGI